MDRHLIISGTIAAALHAGLLFGIPRSKSDRIVADAVKPTFIEIVRDVFDIDPEPVPSDPAEKNIRLGSPENAPPVLPEPPVTPAPTGFELKVPDVPVSTHLIHRDRVPLGPIGVPGGRPDGAEFKPGDVIGSGSLDRSPRTRVQPAPVYPYEAKKNNLSGSVTVEFLVDETGSVVSPRVTTSSDRIFDEAALRAVARWRFEPGRKDGHVVRFRMAVPVVFTLNGD